MSNAMRLGKRTLAGVAAGALALGMLTIASAPAASAKPSIKPKTTSVVQGTVTPVRVTLSPAATVEAVPYASVTWTSTAALGGSETISVQLISAPSPVAVLGIASAVNAAAGANSAYNNSSTLAGADFANDWDTAIIGQVADASSAGLAGVAAATTGRLGFAANEAGTYTGIISVNGVGGSAPVVNNVNFTFTTTGRATSLTLSPATASTTLGGVANLTAELKDAAGNRTQPLWVDSLSLTTTGGTTLPAATVAASALAGGTSTIAYTAPSAAAGSYSVTAAPVGTLPSGGVTAQTSVITVSGSIAETVPFGIGVLNPTDAVNDPTTVTGATGTVPSGTSNITVAIDGGTARLGAGQTLRFSITAPTGGTVNGASTATVAQFATVTLDANGDGTFSFVLGGQALVNNQNTVVRQVTANGSNVTSGAVLTVAQQTPAVGVGTIFPSPGGNLVAALGATTTVQVAVEDQFEDPQAGFTVRAFRGSVTGTLLSSGVTNAEGVATVTVSQSAAAVAGTVETYSFQVQAPGGTITNATATLVITYTAGGNISALTATSTPAVGTTAGAVTSQPLITVPSSGVVTGANTTSTFNPATATATGAATAGTYFAVSVSTSPASNVTLTAPAGAKLVTAIPASNAVLWSGGKSSVTVASPATVYVFSTKTGSAALQVTANQLTTTVPFTVINQGTDYYNMKITPATQDIASGAFGTATVTVTDIFGNPVQTTGAPVSVTATGEVLLSGLSASQTINTGVSGTATLTLIAGARAGLGKVTIAPTAPAANAWAAGYVVPRGAPNPITSGSADVVIKEAAARALIITGERTTVSGKPGIRVEGEADNFENGAKVKPWVRFPGQTSYSEGSARPVITDEQFSWQRKTGKKTYVYFTSEDGTIQSNRVIIAAN